MRSIKNVSIWGLGWLGLPLAEYLQQQGWQVKGTKRKVEHCSIENYSFDLNQFAISDELYAVLQSEAMIITLPPNTTTPEKYREGIQRLVRKAQQHGLAHLIFISSTSVLPMQTGRFDENTPTAPSLLADLEQWLLSQPIHCDILRLAGLVGKQRHPVYYLAGKQQLSGANQPVNLVHLDDAIHAITLLLEKPNGARIFHLCAPEHPTRQAYYCDMAQQLQLPTLHFLPEKDPLERIILADKICYTLGFQYRYRSPYDFKHENRSKKA